MAAERKFFFLKRADKLLRQGEIEPAIEEYKKILEFDKDINIVLKLGKIYLQRKEYDQTYKLFLPIINENIENKKFDEAANLLRFIIASNNSYLPALTKLAEIFKISGKTNNLIALYESLLYVYEEKGMKEELRKTLEELIQLSDTPFGYEEQLVKLAGQQEKEVEGEESSKSLSSVLSEVDFYINDGYFGDADRSMSRGIKRGVEEESTTDSGAPAKEMYDLERCRYGDR